MLHVGHACHGDLEIGFGLTQKCTDQFQKGAPNFGGGIHHEQAKVRGYEFISAAAGVEFPSERAEFLNQGLFDKMMNVLGFRAEFVDPGRAALRAFGNPVKRRERLLRLGVTQNLYALQSLGPSAIDGNFIGEQAPVKRKGTLKRIEIRVRRVFEAPAPQAIVFAFRHVSPIRSFAGREQFL
jgi:hypothetical protein